jgi:Gamma-glutamyl cyclotransferase, AIG2-like
MTFFFFGTLMDRDVIATVLDRPVDSDELSRAWLHGYRRVRAATAAYPVLVPAPGLVVRGVLFDPRSARDDVRIRHFEDGEYIDRWLMAHLPGGRRQPARVFFPLEVLGATDIAWSLHEWAREHKAAFLVRCGEWMRDCPPEPSEAVGEPDPEAPVAAALRRGSRRR